MYCPHCCAQISDEARFCSNCGKSIERNEAGVPKPGAYCPLCGKATGEPVSDGGEPVPNPVPVPVPPIPSKKVSASVVLEAVLIVSTLLLPWFTVNYYYDSVSFSLFTLQDALGRFSSLTSSISGTGSLSSNIAVAGTFALLLGLVPVVLLGRDIYKEVKTAEKSRAGSACAIISALFALLIVYGVCSSISYGTSRTFGVSFGGDILSLDFGWWLTIGLAVANIVLITRANKQQ